MGLLLLLSLTVQAASPALLLPGATGDGARYRIGMKEGGEAELVMSIASNEPGKLGLEVFMESASQLVPIQLWQRFELERKQGSKEVRVASGQLLIPKLGAPQTMPPEMLRGTESSGLDVSAFLLKSTPELESLKVGKENVSTPAGEVSAMHYRREKSGQRLDFWIADAAPPFGLVKLSSRGAKASQNFELVLLSLVRGIRPKIDPSRAVPMSKEVTSVLGNTLLLR